MELACYPTARQHVYPRCLSLRETKRGTSRSPALRPATGLSLQLQIGYSPGLHDAPVRQQIRKSGR